MNKRIPIAVLVCVSLFFLGSIMGRWLEKQDLQKQIVENSCGMYDSITGDFVWLPANTKQQRGNNVGGFYEEATSPPKYDR